MSDILLADAAVIAYMALFLTLGLLTIWLLQNDFPLFVMRKAFHILAFILFIPGIMNSQFYRPRLMVFAFNCVSVFLIILEVLRHFNYMPQSVSLWFRLKSEGRERT